MAARALGGGPGEALRGGGDGVASWRPGGCWGWGDGGDSLASSGGGDLERRAREGIRKPEAGAWPRRRRGRPISHQLAAGPKRGANPDQLAARAGAKLTIH